jgi:integrase
VLRETANARALRMLKWVNGPYAAEVKRCITFLETLRTNANPRLSLMIRFLEVTSCRISEMLNAEVGRVRCGPRIIHATITGKGGWERDLCLLTQLYRETCATFDGTQLLFEHDGRKCSRVATTNRIRELAERTIGKSVTAYLIRHQQGGIGARPCKYLRDENLLRSLSLDR